MTILGMKMAGVRFTKLFAGWRAYYVSAIKLVAVPALSIALAFALRLVFAVSSEMILGVFIAFAVPTAGLASAFADQHKGDTENAVVFTLATTILSIVTLPLLYWALTALL